jgi:hypothetical protein
MKKIIFFGGPQSNSVADYFAIVLDLSNVFKIVGDNAFGQLDEALGSDKPLIFVYSELTDEQYLQAETTIREQDPYNIIHLITTEKHNIPLDTTLLLYVWHDVKAVDVESISKYIHR